MSNFSALTLRKTRKPITLSDYVTYIKWLNDNDYIVGNVHYEDTKGLHLHGVISHKRGIPILQKNLKRDKYGWNVYLVPLYKPEGWANYCKKDEGQDIETQYKQKEIYDNAPDDWNTNSPHSPPSEELIDIVPDDLCFNPNIRYPNWRI